MKSAYDLKDIPFYTNFNMFFIRVDMKSCIIILILKKGTAMAKKMVAFKLEQEIINKLEELAERTGKTKTDIIEKAILCLYRQENRDKEEIELYRKENEQLKIALQILKEREQSLEEVKQSYDKLLSEKDERIKELKERIEELKQSKIEKAKPFWKFWK